MTAVEPAEEQPDAPGVFVLSDMHARDLAGRLGSGDRPGPEIWVKGHFGPALKFWRAAGVRIGRSYSAQHSVSVIGTAEDPTGDSQSPDQLAALLYVKLCEGNAAFRAHAEGLTGRFFLLWRVGADVWLRAGPQDRIWYHADGDGTITASSEPGLIAHLHGLSETADNAGPASVPPGQILSFTQRAAVDPKIPPPVSEFKRRMDERLRRWYQGADPHPDPAVQARRRFLGSLVNKTVMTEYVTRFGIPLPRRHADVRHLDEIDFVALPDRIVIKPDNNADSIGVMLFAAGHELLSGDAVDPAARRAYVTRRYDELEVLKKPGTRIMVEEFVQDYDPAFVIPRDFKVFVAGGKARLIQVIDRNPAKADRTNSFFERDWTHVPQRMKWNYKSGPVYERPPALNQLLEMSDRIAADIGCFYRIDFYMADRGPVFGEFTSYPSAGMSFTGFGDKLMCDLMDLAPDI